ncbi:MAG: EamA family transporter [Candidatus Saccharimonadales bacterium]
MSWHLLILANTFLAAISYIIYRAAARKHTSNHQALAVNAGFYVFQYLAELCVLPFLGHIDSGKFWQYLPWFLAGGAGFAIANLFLYKLLSHIDAGLSSVLGTLNVLFTILFAALVLHEDLNTPEIIGSLILLFAISYVVLVVRKPGGHRRTSRAWLWGLWFALLAGVFYGAAAVNEKFLVGHMNLATYMLFGWSGQVLMAIVMGFGIRPQSAWKFVTKPKTLRLIAAGGVTRGAAGLLFLLALVRANNVAVVTVVSNFRLILIVLLGAVFLKERQKIPEKLFASLLALAALAIIFWL